MPETKEQVGWKVPADVLVKFRDFCSDTGSNYQDSLAAAMVIWCYLPPSIQRQAQLEASGKPAIDKKSWKQYSARLEAAIIGQVYNPKNRH